MKIQLVSDIHLEFGHMVNIDNAGADVLVLAGDICCARHLKVVDDFMPLPIERKNAINFFKDCASKFQNVIYIMGNHEHYHGDFQTSRDLLQTMLDQYSGKNVFLMEKDSITIGDTEFVGGTYWTNFYNG